MQSKRKNLLSIAGIIILLIAMFIIPQMQKRNYRRSLHYEEVIVTRGDSLWKIGLDKCPEKMDIRDWIYDVNEHNSIDTNVYPGMSLEVLTDD